MHPALDRLFEEHTGHAATSRVAMTGAGGARRMFRLADQATSAVGVVGPDPKENRAFLAYTETFRGLDLPVPAVYGVDVDAGVYLLEDLGNETLFQALTAARAADPAGAAFPASMHAIYRRVIEWLPRFQVEGGRAVDYAVAHPHPAFDERSMRWDLNYFKYHFLKLAHVPFDEARLESDFDQLVALLTETDTTHFVYRDFQSRNVMLQAGAPRFIDYQGGRRGALPYDVASLLFDGKAAIPPEVRAELLDHYLDVLETYVPVARPAFLTAYRGYVLIRILQAMGAYGYRGFYERKPHFLASVPHAIENLAYLVQEGQLPAPLPELSAVIGRLADHETLRRHAPKPPDGGLVIRVGSFSYKHGAPEDPGGHGGGYAFDCRGLLNPGREAIYTTLTGRDEAVVNYLEALPEVQAFYAQTEALVRAHVDAYRARGFTSLQVLFGCTGGQHRSVYMAERLGRALDGAYPEAHVPVHHAQAHAWPKPATEA